MVLPENHIKKTLDTIPPGFSSRLESGPGAQFSLGTSLTWWAVFEGKLRAVFLRGCLQSLFNPYCYLFLMSVFIFWVSYYISERAVFRFAASALGKLPSIYVFSYFPFGFEGRMWNLIVSVPDHCLSFYFVPTGKS